MARRIDPFVQRLIDAVSEASECRVPRSQVVFALCEQAMYLSCQGEQNYQPVIPGHFCDLENLSDDDEAKGG